MEKNYKRNFDVEFNTEELLKYAVTQGIINLDDVRNDMREQEKQRILKMHPYEIWLSKDGRWRTYLPDENNSRKRRMVAKQDRVKLENELIAFYTKDEDDAYISLTNPTLAELYPQWIVYRNSLTRSSSTIKRFKSIWNTWYKDKEISEKHILDLDYLYLNQWANTIVKEHNLDKKQYYLISCVAKQLFAFAMEKHYINVNPFDRVKVHPKMFAHKKKPSSKEQVFIVSEQELLAEEAKRKFEARPWCMSPLLVLLNFQIGLRIGELVAIKWEDIKENYIMVNRMETTTYKVMETGEVVPDGYKVVPYVKSEAGYREVYLNSIAKSLLAEIKKTHLKNGYFDEGYIFIASRTGQRGTSRTFTKYLENLCKSAGVINKSNHKIRKTYISSLFDYGVNINTIREQAGHEDEKTSLNNYCFDQKDLAERESMLEKAANIQMAILKV